MSEAARPHTVSAAEWDARYRSGELPWDTQRPSPELMRVLDEGFAAPPGRALELGCGTGTNAIYLAQRRRISGYGPGSIGGGHRSARQRAEAAAVRVDFFDSDVAAAADGSARSTSSSTAVATTACRRVNLAGYLASVERLTRPGTKFLLLAGNANEERRRAAARPRLRNSRRIRTAV